METFCKKKIWSERGINLEELVNTPIPATVNDMGWGGLVATSPNYSERPVREFYTRMNPGEFMRSALILVRRVPVYLNTMDINISFGTTLLDFEEL